MCVRVRACAFSRVQALDVGHLVFSSELGLRVRGQEFEALRVTYPNRAAVSLWNDEAPEKRLCKCKNPSRENLSKNRTLNPGHLHVLHVTNVLV